MNNIKVVLEDLSKHPEIEIGYADPVKCIVYIDENAPRQKQRLTVVHEILEIYLGTEIEHWWFDILADDILDGLEQL